MVSKNWIKLVKSLQIKKYRKEKQLFFVEGAKSVQELLNSSFKIEKIFATDSFFQENESIISQYSVELAKEQELIQMGSLQSNNAVLAVAHTYPNEPLFLEGDEFILMLDDVQDPGNLGTIIRICDWYGIKKIICSLNTVDLYNPKVLNSSMGSFTRVSLYYTDIVDYISNKIKEADIYGTFMNGENIHKTSFSKKGFIIMGNEANGINPVVENFVEKRISIPRFGEAESLNVGIATAVVLDNLRRK